MNYNMTSENVREHNILYKSKLIMNINAISYDNILIYPCTLHLHRAIMHRV